jgi:arylformamidase
MRKGSKIIDISLQIFEGMITYPENPPVVFEPEQGSTTARTVITIGSHTGTHIDAPSHAERSAKPIDQLSLAIFMGPCRVIDATGPDFGASVSAELLHSRNIRQGERLLIKTRNSFRGFARFYDDYVYLDGEAAEYLAEHRVTLVGIDSLSIKQRGSSDQRPHTALLQKAIPILEGLDLSDVEEGTYFLYALPLRFVGIDGSPCRAVLVS